MTIRTGRRISILLAKGDFEMIPKTLSTQKAQRKPIKIQQTSLTRCTVCSENVWIFSQFFLNLEAFPSLNLS
jgi:hypothetical protein